VAKHEPLLFISTVSTRFLILTEEQRSRKALKKYLDGKYSNRRMETVTCGAGLQFVNTARCLN